MDDQLTSSIARTMEASQGIIPYLPELLVDLWALGSSPEIIANLLKYRDLSPAATKVLDLGCGKGAVSITIAKELGFQVVGVDGNKEFLNQAILKARENKVADLCSFQIADIRTFIKTANNFDVVILASLGNILGDYPKTIARLRRVIRPDGYIILDDGFLKPGKQVKRSGYEHYAGRDVVKKQLTHMGDLLVEEIVLPDESTRTINQEYLNAIKRRGRELIRSKPALKELISCYIATQEEECDFIDQNLTSAIWLLQKKKSEN